MKRTLVQIGQILVILVVILMIPLFIESKNLQTRGKKAPEVSQTAAVSAQVLGASTSKLSESTFMGISQKSVQKVALYTLAPLFIISVLSFAKFKVTKKNI